MVSRKAASQAAALQLKGADRNLSPFVVPRAITQHPLVATRDFYTFPARLLNSIVKHVGQDRFDAQLLEIERQLSALVGDHSVYVGIRREAPIAYGHLEPFKWCAGSLLRRRQAPQLEYVGAGNPGVSVHRKPQCETLTEQVRGYCGWLMTNGTYVAEHDQLFREHAAIGSVSTILQCLSWRCLCAPSGATVRRTLGRCLSGLLWPLAAAITKWSRIAAALPALLASFPAVAHVWLLPREVLIPLSPRLPAGIDPGRSARGHRRRCSRRRASEHLAQWKHIIRRQNPAKNAIARYGRLFSLQHFCGQFMPAIKMPCIATKPAW